MQLEVENSKAIQRSIFLASCEAGKFPAVADQIPKLTNICRRDKTPDHQVVLKDVSDPFGIPFVGFLPRMAFTYFG